MLMVEHVAANLPRRTRLGDVANRAGVGTSTASRALSGRGYVSEDVRRRVLAAADELNYLRNDAARLLRVGASSQVGVIVCNLRDQFYCELATSIEATLKRHRYNMNLLTDNGDEQEEFSAVETLLTQRVAGIILTPVAHRSVRRIINDGVPVVQADRVVPRLGTDNVTGANATGARIATQHLIEHGHRVIAMLIDESKWTTGRNRLRGFREAHQQNNLHVDDELVVFAPGDVAAIRHCVGDLLHRRPDVTALFAGNGLLAEGAVTELQSRGLRIPADLSVVAYDDAPWMNMVSPGITAVTQHTQDLGTSCAEILLQRLERHATPARKSVRIEPSLVIRGSVKTAIE